MAKTERYPEGGGSVNGKWERRSAFEVVGQALNGPLYLVQLALHLRHPLELVLSAVADLVDHLGAQVHDLDEPIEFLAPDIEPPLRGTAFQFGERLFGHGQSKSARSRRAVSTP